MIRIQPALTAFLLTIQWTFASPTVATKGFGVRAGGLGNNFTAVADDFSAMYWNPAGFGFTPIRELYFSAGGYHHSNEAVLQGTTTRDKQQNFRISGAGFVRSIPTTQGGLSFAFGYFNSYLFDDIANQSGSNVYIGDDSTIPYATPVYIDSLTRISSGHLDNWAVSGGIQIAQGLAVGATLSFLSGKQNTDLRDLTRNDVYTDWASVSEKSFYGFGSTIGFLYKTSRFFAAGLRLDLPLIAKVFEDYEELDRLYPEYSISASYEEQLSSTLSGTWGASFSLPAILVAADAHFRSPTANTGLLTSNEELAYWKLGAGIGFELPIKAISSRLRAGYAFNETDLQPVVIVDFPPYGSILDDYGKHMFAAGFSHLISNSINFEAGYQYSFRQLQSGEPDFRHTTDEFHQFHKVNFGISVRY
ncbi:MAG: hypothetical protein GF398_11925 [Chitinivibrionales bacterium]|nr:hypothetical protein [Chitinivibrionales bacterium]